MTGVAIETLQPNSRIVSMARIRLDPWKSVRPFKGIFCHDISEFESYMPSHAVGSLWGDDDPKGSPQSGTQAAADQGTERVTGSSPQSPEMNDVSGERRRLQHQLGRGIDQVHVVEVGVKPHRLSRRACRRRLHARADLGSVHHKNTMVSIHTTQTWRARDRAS